jgi:hypothetical protein
VTASVNWQTPRLTLSCRSWPGTPLPGTAGSCCGAGGATSTSVFEGQPGVVHPTRDFYLLRGALSTYRNLPDSPNYWWPDDRAWCLCTDTDFYWAYIAGSAACITEVLAVPELDAYETNPGNPARSGMDVINDPDGTVPRRP